MRQVRDDGEGSYEVAAADKRHAEECCTSHASLRIVQEAEVT